ncbi:heterodisulfide reductase-related iron-sulfur binding cluster [Chloroflexota bacterium]
MLDRNMITNIRGSGIVQGAVGAEERDRLLKDDLGFRRATRAEYVLIASCFLPSQVTQDLRAFRNILHHYDVDYSILPREYCCGDLVIRQAIKGRDEDELSRADDLGREFLENNLRQIREMGAGKIILFCISCDSVYNRFRGNIRQEILWYPTLLARLFRAGKLDIEADYYAGCHYHYKRLCPTLPDLDASRKIFDRIEGLRLNPLNHQLCCTRPQQVEALAASIRSKTVITECGGCAILLREILKDRGGYRVVMLPQVVWAAISGVWPPP